MNSLNLRVSTVKTGENVKKNSELRAALVALPKKYDNVDKPYCLDFKCAKTINEQTHIIKNIFKTLGADEFALQFLCDLYFYSTLKHPVRNQVSKLLLTAARFGTGGIEESSIITALAHSQLTLLEETKNEKESSKWNFTVTSSAGCFENFQVGLKSLEQNINLVFPFLSASIQKYLTELGVLNSPSVRNEYYLYIHNSIRLALSCLQEFSTNLKDSQGDQLKQLNSICRNIIIDNEIPMDPRTNSGILIAQTSKLFNDYDSFMQEVKSTKNANDIALCFGVISICDQHDFQLYSSDIRDICSKIDEIANSNATLPQILLCAARALYQVSKLMLSLDTKMAGHQTQANATTTQVSGNAEDDVKLILRKLLIFTFGYLEHHMDSVRHLCRDILRNIVAAAKKIHFDFLQQKIYDACNSERLSLSMKCVVLQQASVILGAEQIIEHCPELFTGLFAGNLGRDFIVNNLFEALMSASHRELAYEQWYKRWIEYLLQMASANDDRLADIETLIVKAVKCEPRIVQEIVQENSDSSAIPISTKLSSLWAVRKSGIQLPNFNEIMQKFSKNLLRSILSNNDETRIMALRLLVETNKTTEVLSSLECEQLLTYLEYNSNCQSPATRQKTLALLGKALLRCELNLLKSLKDTQGKGKLNKTLQYKFLLDFMRILVSNLFRGANFSRRAISLQLLQQCIGICNNCNLDLREMLPPNTLQRLAESINDSYEANKDLAMTNLKLIEDKFECKLIEKYDLNINLNEIHALLISVRPTDSITAAYQLDFFCNRMECEKFGEFELPSYSPTHYAALRWVLSSLKDGLKLAKSSLLQVAKLNPLYGNLFAIEHLLKRLDFQMLAQDLIWRILVAELIVLCKELTAVVAPVVNSSSPEGHLPNDFSAFPAEYAEADASATPLSSSPSQASPKILSSKHRKLNLAAIKTTPQMVLLCAWRTVKEVSLILGEIVLRSPIQFNAFTEHFLVTKEQIIEVGDHFKLLLAETKHRGAFEQAYVGFSKLCCRLWRIEVPELSSLPLQWLREFIALISLDEQINEKLCPTRRSAGLPFMIQALITSELQMGSTKSLYYCMSHLLQLCRASERTADSRTHALNILRALFRCTELNEAVGEFVADGVMVAIRCYNANTWSEKNSATLLFATLITRIFGVQRTKDSENLSIRNRMTGRIFFLRYPKLFDFFLEELREATALVKHQQKAVKLHPLLLILSRLYPSALEGTESNLKISEFLPYICTCAGCPEMQTRFLASKAVVALTAKDAAPVTILRRCADIILLADSSTAISLNELHGHLLQLYMLVKTHKNLSAEIFSDVVTTLVTFHEKTQINNAVVLKVMLDIYVELLQDLNNLAIHSQATRHDLLYFTTQKQLYANDLGFVYPVFRKSFDIYNLHVLRLTLPYGALSDYLLSLFLTNESVPLEHTETCLNIILLVLVKRAGDKRKRILEGIEFTSTEQQLVRSLDEDTLQELANELRGSKALHVALKDLLQKRIYYPECTMKAYAILSLLENFDFTLSALTKESKKHTGDVKATLTLCVDRLIVKNGVDFKTSQSCLEYLLEIAQPWQSDCLRLKASKILSYLAVHYRRALEKKKSAFLKSFITLTLTLLMDDDFEIRDQTARVVLAMMQDEVGMADCVATMAQRLFLQYTADVLLAMKADDNYVLDVFKIIADTSSTVVNSISDDSASSSAGGSESNSIGQGSALNDDSLEVFDKNEANVFAEPFKIIMDCVVVFRSTFSERKKVMNFLNDCRFH